MIKVCSRYSRNINEAGILYNEAMFKVFTNIRQFDGKGEFEAWVKRIAINTCIDNCRKQAKFKHEEIESLSNDPTTFNPEIYGVLSAKEIIALIRDLPRNTALVFNMFVLEGYTHEEIGKTLGIAKGTSKWHLNEARRILKIELNKLVTIENLSNAG